MAILGTLAATPCLYVLGMYLDRRAAARAAARAEAGEEPLRPARRSRCRCAQDAVLLLCAPCTACTAPLAAAASATCGACTAPCKACGKRAVAPALVLRVREAAVAAPTVAPAAGDHAAPAALWRRVALAEGGGADALRAAVLRKLRAGQEGWRVVRMVQVPGGVLVEDDDDVADMSNGDALEVHLARDGGKGGKAE